MCLVHPHHGSLLPSNVSNVFALVNSACIHICGCTLISQKSLGMLHTSLPVPLPQDCQCLSVGAHVHLVRFRAASCHMWPLPCINIFNALQLLASLGGHQLESHSPECECEFVWLQPKSSSAVMKMREGSKALMHDPSSRNCAVFMSYTYIIFTTNLK